MSAPKTMTVEERAREMAGVLGLDLTEAEEVVIIPALRAHGAEVRAKALEEAAEEMKACGDRARRNATSFHDSDEGHAYWHSRASFYDSAATAIRALATATGEGGE